MNFFAMLFKMNCFNNIKNVSIVLQKANAPNGIVAGNHTVAIDMGQFPNEQYQDQMFEEQVRGYPFNLEMRMILPL